MTTIKNIDNNGISMTSDDNTKSISLSMNNVNNTTGLNLQYDKLGTTKEFFIDETGMSFTIGPTTKNSSLARICQVEELLQAVDVPPNSQTLYLNKRIVLEEPLSNSSADLSNIALTMVNDATLPNPTILTFNNVNIEHTDNNGVVLTKSWTDLISNSGAATIDITDTQANSTFYPTFVDNSGTGLTVNIDKTTNPLSYNPSTGTLSSTLFNGTANNASALLVFDTQSNSTFYPTFVDNTGGNRTIFIDKTTNPLSYNPTSGTLTSLNYNGVASSANSMNIVNTNANLTFYPTLCNTSGLSQIMSIDSSATPLSYNPSTSTLNATIFNGTATTTDAINIDVVNNTNATYYPVFTDDSGLTKPIHIDKGITPLTYNPFTSTITAINFSGNSTTSTIATTADNVKITDIDTNALYYPTLTDTSGASKELNIDKTTTPFSYNPSTSTINALNFSGNASTSDISTVASKLDITIDNTNGEYYLPFSKTAGLGGAKDFFIDGTITGIKYNPSLETLTISNLNGNSTSATNANNIDISSSSTNASFYPTFSSSTTGYDNLNINTDLSYNPSSKTLTFNNGVDTHNTHIDNTQVHIIDTATNDEMFIDHNSLIIVNPTTGEQLEVLSNTLDFQDTTNIISMGQTTYQSTLAGFEAYSITNGNNTILTPSSLKLNDIVNSKNIDISGDNILFTNTTTPNNTTLDITTNTLTYTDNNGIISTKNWTDIINQPPATLANVLIAGNSAGASAINMNGNSITNLNALSAFTNLTLATATTTGNFISFKSNNTERMKIIDNETQFKTDANYFGNDLFGINNLIASTIETTGLNSTGTLTLSTNGIVRQSISVGGITTFTTLPESAILPTTNNQFSNKRYIDERSNILNTITNTTSNIDYLPVFSTSSGIGLSLYDDTTYKYNPSTGTLTATIFNGNATTSTTATNANKLLLTNNTSSFTGYVPFTQTATGNSDINTTSGFRYNPNVNSLTVGAIVSNMIDSEYNTEIKINSAGTTLNKIKYQINSIDKLVIDNASLSASIPLNMFNNNVYSLSNISGGASSTFDINSTSNNLTLSTGGNVRQTISNAGLITYTSLPQCSSVPSNVADLTNKAYVDSVAGGSSTVTITENNSAGNFYPAFVNGSGTGKSLYIDSLTTGMSYTPDTSTLYASNFVGDFTGNLSGNATTASSVSGITITSDNTSGTYYLPFTKTAGTGVNTLFKDDTTTALTYNPSTSTLTCSNFNGTVGTANNVVLTSDNTAGTYYLPFSKTTASASNALYIDDTTNPLTYNPSTGALSCVSFTGGCGAVTTTSDNTNTTCYIPFTKVAANPSAPLYVDDTTGPLTYNPLYGVLNMNYYTISELPQSSSVVWSTGSVLTITPAAGPRPTKCFFQNVADAGVGSGIGNIIIPGTMPVGAEWDVCWYNTGGGSLSVINSGQYYYCNGTVNGVAIQWRVEYQGTWVAATYTQFNTQYTILRLKKYIFANNVPIYTIKVIKI